MHANLVDLARLGVEVNDEIAGPDDRLGMTLRAAYDGVDAGDQFVPVEWLRHVIVGAEAETLDLILDAGNSGEYQDRCLHLGDAQRSEHLETRHIGQIQVEQNDVVVVELAEIDALSAQISPVDVEALAFEHQYELIGRS